MVHQVDDETMNSAKRARESSQDTPSSQRRVEGLARDVTSAKSTSSNLMAPAAAASLVHLAQGITVAEDIDASLVEPSQPKMEGHVPGKADFQPPWDHWAPSWNA